MTAADEHQASHHHLDPRGERNNDTGQAVRHEEPKRHETIQDTAREKRRRCDEARERDGGVGQAVREEEADDVAGDRVWFVSQARFYARPLRKALQQYLPPSRGYR